MADDALGNDLQATLSAAADPRLYEVFYKIVAEAQAAGSVVLLAAVMPPAGGDGPTAGFSAQSCKPRAEICPK